MIVQFNENIDIQSKLIEVAEHIDGFFGSKRSYFDLYERSFMKAVSDKLDTVESMMSSGKDTAVVARMLDEIIGFIDKTDFRLTVSPSKSDIVTIHQIRASKKMPEESYRSLMWNTVGCSTSKDLSFWKAKVFLHALSKWSRS